MLVFFHAARRFGGAGFSRNQIFYCTTGAAQVFMAHVGNGLIVGHRVDGGHQAFGDAHFIVQYFGNRC